MSDRELTGATGLPVATADRRSEQLGYGAGWLTSALPLGMQADPRLVAFVTIIEEVASTLRAGADSISNAADVDVTSPAMVRYLGSWVGALALHSDLDLQHQRKIVKATGATLGRCGTSDGIARILAALTGGSVDVDDDGGVFREGRAPTASSSVTVRVAQLGHLLEHQLVELTLALVPAHLLVTIECAGHTVHPPQEAP